MTFNQKGNLTKHKELRHDREKTLPSDYAYECETCGLRTKTKHGLQHHTENKHQGIRYDCDVCIKSFDCQSHLNRHKKLHRDDSKLIYEKKLLEGKKLLKFYVEECVPAAVMTEEDMEKINLYRKYTYQKIDTYKDEYVPL